MNDDASLLPPLFILSCERSGSTLLRCLLDAHPDIAAPGELMLGDLCARFKLILERTVALTPAARADGSSPEEAILEEIRRTAGGILDRYCRAKGARLWCEKTPANLGYADLLAQVFPAARFLCLYRDGLDVAYSCIEASRWGFMREVAPFVAMSPENLPLAMIRNWIVKTTGLLDFEARLQERCFRLRYEDLVADPAGRIDAVLQFLELPGAPGQIERAFTMAHDPGGGDPGFFKTSGVEPDRLGIGRRELLPRLPREAVPRTTDLLARLGYPPLTPALAAHLELPFATIK